MQFIQDGPIFQPRTNIFRGKWSGRPIFPGILVRRTNFFCRTKISVTVPFLMIIIFRNSGIVARSLRQSDIARDGRAAIRMPIRLNESYAIRFCLKSIAQVVAETQEAAQICMVSYSTISEVTSVSLAYPLLPLESCKEVLWRRRSEAVEWTFGQ